MAISTQTETQRRPDRAPNLRACLNFAISVSSTTTPSRPSATSAFAVPEGGIVALLGSNGGGKIDASEGDVRHSLHRRRRDRERRHPVPERGRCIGLAPDQLVRRGIVQGARRPARISGTDHRREPANGRVYPEQQRKPADRRDQVVLRCSRACSSGATRSPGTCPAANSSRCWRSAAR